MGENFEIRSYGGNAQPKLVDGRTVTGYAIVFNSPSEVLYDAKTRKFFREIIKPEAISDEFVRTQDVKLNRNHNDDILLGRSRMGQGTLKLEIDDIGLKYTAELPETTAGNDTLELIRRGDLFGSSFRFIYGTAGVRTTKQDDNICLREVSKIGGLYDVSVVADPAYMATSVTVRSLESAIEAEQREEVPAEEPKPAAPEEPAQEPEQPKAEEAAASEEPAQEPEQPKAEEAAASEEPAQQPEQPKAEAPAAPEKEPEKMSAEEIAFIDAEIAKLDNFKF